jgi:hypothetical protein
MSQRALLSADVGAASNLQITFQDRPLQKPYLLSARIENSGDLPIEERDIEGPVSMTFMSARVITVEITGVHPAGLFATATNAEKTIIISHKLLNQGDWIAFDVLLDGDPDEPTISARISGIPSITTIPLSAQQRAVSTTAAWPLPKPVTYAALVLATFLGALLLIVASGSIVSAGKVFFVGKQIGEGQEKRMIRGRAAIDSNNLIGGIVAFVGGSGIVIIAIGMWLFLLS